MQSELRREVRVTLTIACVVAARTLFFRCCFARASLWLPRAAFVERCVERSLLRFAMQCVPARFGAFYRKPIAADAAVAAAALLLEAADLHAWNALELARTPRRPDALVAPRRAPRHRLTHNKIEQTDKRATLTSLRTVAM